MEARGAAAGSQNGQQPASPEWQRAEEASADSGHAAGSTATVTDAAAALPLLAFERRQPYCHQPPVSAAAAGASYAAPASCVYAAAEQPHGAALGHAVPCLFQPPGSTSPLLSGMQLLPGTGAQEGVAAAMVKLQRLQEEPPRRQSLFQQGGGMFTGVMPITLPHDESARSSGPGLGQHAAVHPHLPQGPAAAGELLLLGPGTQHHPRHDLALQRTGITGHAPAASRALLGGVEPGLALQRSHSGPLVPTSATGSTHQLAHRLQPQAMRAPQQLAQVRGGVAGCWPMHGGS